MPFDGTDYAPRIDVISPAHRAALALRTVATVLELYGWCKYRHCDHAGRYCLVGAFHAQADKESARLSKRYLRRAIRERTGRWPGAIVWYNDRRKTTYADVRAVIDRAAEMAMGDA